MTKLVGSLSTKPVCRVWLCDEPEQVYPTDTQWQIDNRGKDLWIFRRRENLYVTQDMLDIVCTWPEFRRVPRDSAGHERPDWVGLGTWEHAEEDAESDFETGIGRHRRHNESGSLHPQCCALERDDNRWLRVYTEEERENMLEQEMAEEHRRKVIARLSGGRGSLPAGSRKAAEMTPDRRGFLKMLGLTAAAAVLEPARVMAATATSPERLLTLVSFMAEGAHKVPVRGQLSLTGLILPAPHGRKCRALVYPTGIPRGRWDDVASPLDPWAGVYVTGVIGGNEPSEVIITKVANATDDLSFMASELDAAIFSQVEPSPVDWGLFTNAKPLLIDYEAAGPWDIDQTLYLGLVYQGIDQHEHGIFR